MGELKEIIIFNNKTTINFKEGGTKRIIGVGDTESLWSNNRGLEAKIYCWHVALENGIELKGDTIEELFKSLISLPKSKIKYYIYFHNLKWDGEFLLEYLIKNFPENLSFLKVEEGTIYYIKWKNIVFLDSYLFLGASVKDLTRNHERLERKKNYDYDEIKPWNYKATEKDRLLCRDDCLTVLEWVKHFPQVKSSFPIVSIANLADWEFKKSIGLENYDNLFPNIDLEYLRLWYRGGLTYNWNYYHIENELVSLNDINSCYPFIMRNFKLPFGLPAKTKSKKFNYGFYTIKIERVKIIDEIKPFISVEKENFLNIYPKIIENAVIYLEERIFELFKKYYFGNYHLIKDKCYFFQSRVIFKEIVDKWNEEQFTAEINGDEISKWILKQKKNSLYGSFAKLHERKRLVLKRISEKDKKRKVKVYLGKNNNYYKLEAKKNLSWRFSYLAVAVAITATARAYLIEKNIQIGDRLLGSDTDSNIIKGLLPKELLNLNEPGKFKSELFTHFHCKASKAYFLWDKDNRGHKIMINLLKKEKLNANDNYKIIIENKIKEIEEKIKLNPNGIKVVKNKGVSKDISNDLTWEQWISNEPIELETKQAHKVKGGYCIRKVKKILLPAQFNRKKNGIDEKTKKWIDY